jgi:hypothetical protein
MNVGVDPAQDQYELEDLSDPSLVQTLIQQYLIHHCYTETALAFGKHLNERDVDMELIQRKEIKEAILQGCIPITR